MTTPIEDFEHTLAFFVSHGKMPYDWATPLKDWQAVKAYVKELEKWEVISSKGGLQEACKTCEAFRIDPLEDALKGVTEQLAQSQRELEHACVLLALNLGNIDDVVDEIDETKITVKKTTKDANSWLTFIREAAAEATKEKK